MTFVGGFHEAGAVDSCSGSGQRPAYDHSGAFNQAVQTLVAGATGACPAERRTDPIWVVNGWLWAACGLGLEGLRLEVKQVWLGSHSGHPGKRMRTSTRTGVWGGEGDLGRVYDVGNVVSLPHLIQRQQVCVKSTSEWVLKELWVEPSRTTG